MKQRKKFYHPFPHDPHHYELQGTKTEFVLVLIFGLIVVAFLRYKYYAQPLPGETADSGHWHGDVWHAEPHQAHAPADANAPTDAGDSDALMRSQSQKRPQTAVEAHAPVSDILLTTASEDAYQALREKYPEQTQNPHPFENVPVDLWDFEATKTAFMDHFNFYVEHYDPKEGGSHTRELRIASAIMANIHNAARPWVGLYTPEQREEINAMHRRYFDFKGVKVNHERVWELVHDEGYSVSEALRISREEGNNR